jgi:thiamine biosynthesis lipoprotein
MPVVTLARNAMATRFEIALHGGNPAALRAAGEEALEEIEQLEARLSLFRPGSEIAHLNARAAREPVRVTPALFALLQHAQRLHAESGGAFDITIAPLVRCWGFMHGSGHVPDPEELAEARAKVGMSLVLLDADKLTVRFARAGVMLDLGAIGKGYAIERAAELLREAGVTSALLHGGTSTVYALGRPPEAEFWNVSIPSAAHRMGRQSNSMPSQTPAAAGAVPVAPGRQPDRRDAGAAGLAIARLKDEAMSVSAVWGKCFQAEGKTFGHILDPRTGRPATAAILAAVILPSATETDALSTALLTLGPEGHERIANLRPGMKSLVVSETDGQFSVQSNGIPVDAPP